MTSGVVRFTGRSLAMLLLCGCTGVVLDAQERPSNTHDVLAVTVTSDATSEDNGEVENDPRAPQFRGRQVYYGLNTTVTYDSMNQENLGWQLSATTGVRRYPSLNEWLSSGNLVGGRGAFTLGKRTSISVNGSGGYIPDYSLGLVPTSTGPGSALGTFSSMDLAVDRRPAYTSSLGVAITQKVGAQSTVGLTYAFQRVDFQDAAEPSWTGTNANLSFTHRFSQRSSLIFGYALQKDDFVNATDPSLTATTANVRFTYRFAKNTGFHLGYGRREGQFDFSANRQSDHIDDIDVGLDYDRALSLSRRTTIAFSSGSSIYGEAGQRRYAVTGVATLNRAIGREGHIGVNYNRGFGFVEGFAQPVFSDTLAANANIWFGSRVQFIGSAGYGIGDVTQPQTDNGYRALSGSGRVSVALASRALLNMEYLYYQHHIGDAYQLLRTTTTEQERKMLRISISFRAPIISERLRAKKKGTT